MLSAASSVPHSSVAAARAQVSSDFLLLALPSFENDLRVRPALCVAAPCEHCLCRQRVQISVKWAAVPLCLELTSTVSYSQIEAPAERLRVVEFLGRIFAHAEDTWHKYRSLFIALLERARKVRPHCTAH